MFDIRINIIVLGRPYIRPRKTGPNDGSDISIAVAESHAVPLVRGVLGGGPWSAVCAVGAGDELCCG